MKRLVLISLCLLTWFDAIGQSIEIPDDTIISKFRIKTVIRSSFYDTDTTIESYQTIWKFDTLGRWTFRKQIDAEDKLDTADGPDEDYNFYKGNKLIENWKIGMWRINTKRIDTTISKYNYDSNGKLLEDSYRNIGMKWNYTTTHKYNGNYELDITNDNIDSWNYSTDSIIYLTNGKIVYSYYYGRFDQLIQYKYNDAGQIVLKKECNLSDTTEDRHYYEYYYQGGLLIKEIELLSNYFDPSSKFYKERGCNYYYDRKGLLREIRRLDDNSIMEKYRYEYY